MGLLEAADRREYAERQRLGALVAAAVNDPSKINQALGKEPPARKRSGSSSEGFESERWW